MKVAVVTPIPTPYRDPFWEVFGNQDEVDLSVIYCSSGKADRPWSDEATDFSHSRLFPEGRNIFGSLEWGASCYWNPAIKKHLHEIQPDIALIGGYNHFTMLSAVKFCNRNRIPWLLMSESWKQRTGTLGKLKQAWLKRWLSKAAGMLPTGSRAAANAKRLGIAEANQSRLPNVPDIDGLREFSASLQPQRAAIKAKAGIAAGRRLIVFAARMVPKKRPLLVLEGFASLKENDAVLMMIGDGPDRTEVEARTAALGVEDRVRFPGFLQPQEVHEWMSVADIFVQPSRETWGVAPIEALSCGTPVILSDQIGCADDVVTSPQLGRIVPSVNVENFSATLNELLTAGLTFEQVRMAQQDWASENSYHSLSRRLLAFCKGCLQSTLQP